MFLEQQIIIISEESCDTEENLDLITGINYIL